MLVKLDMKHGNPCPLATTLALHLTASDNHLFCLQIMKYIIGRKKKSDTIVQELSKMIHTYKINLEIKNMKDGQER